MIRDDWHDGLRPVRGMDVLVSKKVRRRNGRRGVRGVPKRREGDGTGAYTDTRLFKDGLLLALVLFYTHFIRSSASSMLYEVVKQAMAPWGTLTDRKSRCGTRTSRIWPKLNFVAPSDAMHIESLESRQKKWLRVDNENGLQIRTQWKA